MLTRACVLIVVALLLYPPQRTVKWTYASSPHFEVFTSGGDRAARDALSQFEDVRTFLTDFLRLAPKRANPTRLIIFSNDREFAPYRPNEVAAAFYQAGPDRDQIVMRSLNADSRPTVVHEYMHLMVRHSGAAYPVWLNEGLAVFFSTMEATGNQMSLGRVPVSRLRDLADSPRLLELPRLLAVSHQSPEYNTKAHAGLFYSQSWALTHMILADDRYRAQSGRFLAAVADGTPSAEALESIYARPIAAIARDLEAYVRRQAYAYFVVNRPARPDKMTMATREATSFEAGLALANLLAARPNAEAEARDAFEALAQERPDDPGVVEARAYFELRRGHREQAAAYFAKAVALGSRNPLIYRDFARVMIGADPAKAESLLATALELGPDDVDIRISYAAALSAGNKGRDALAALAPIKRVPAESAFMLFQVLARANLQVGNLEDARAAAARLRSIAAPGEQTRVAERLVQMLDELAPPKTGSGRTTFVPPTRTAGTVEQTGPVRQAEELTIVQARIKNLVCSGKQPIVEIAAATGQLRLLIDDPLAIKVEGAKGPQIDLTCGPQDRPARIGYLPKTDAALKTNGLVRLLDFR